MVLGQFGVLESAAEYEGLNVISGYGYDAAFVPSFKTSFMV